jgi:hypothetical protein
VRDCNVVVTVGMEFVECVCVCVWGGERGEVSNVGLCHVCVCARACACVRTEIQFIHRMLQVDQRCLKASICVLYLTLKLVVPGAAMYPLFPRTFPLFRPQNFSVGQFLNLEKCLGFFIVLYFFKWY